MYTNYATEFDGLGTSLWNLTARLMREHDHENKNACVLLRVYAYCLLDCVTTATSRTLQNNIRLLKTAIKAAKLCLEHSEIEHAQYILSSAASITDALDKHGAIASLQHPRGHDSEESASLCKALNVEYLTLRIMLVSPVQVLSTLIAIC